MVGATPGSTVEVRMVRHAFNNWNLRETGQALVDLLNAWTTPTQQLVVEPDGTIDFTGFYGRYEIVLMGKKMSLFRPLVDPRATTKQHMVRKLVWGSSCSFLR